MQVQRATMNAQNALTALLCVPKFPDRGSGVSCSLTDDSFQSRCAEVQRVTLRIQITVATAQALGVCPDRHRTVCNLAPQAALVQPATYHLHCRSSEPPYVPRMP